MESNLHFLDQFLARRTPYRLMLVGLGTLALVSIAEAFLGWLPYTAIDLSVSLILLLFSARTTSALCSLFSRSQPNPESSYITALLLFFILTPIQSAHDALVLLIAAALAVLSKYIFALRKSHFFNPAAFSALAVSILWPGMASWWVAMPVLLPFVSVLAILVVRKSRQSVVFWNFVAASFVFFAVRLFFAHAFAILGSLQEMVRFSYLTPLVFLAAFMLSDPQTMPHGKSARRIYAWIVGALFALVAVFSPVFTAPVLFAVSASWLAISPQLALLAGTIFTLFVEKRKNLKYELSLHSVTPLSREVFEFAFLPSRPFIFTPGQYMEWTLPHASRDERGTRRYFSITSSPADPFVRFCTTLPVEGSSFKDALRVLQPSSLKNSVAGSRIFASNRAGEFILPKDPDTKLLMLVSGVGIAPCMSMFRTLAEKRERRDMVLIYSAITPMDFIYQKEIDSLKGSIGLKVHYIPIDFPELSDWKGDSGHITAEYIQKKSPDYRERHWMLSGPQAYVQEFRWISQTMRIPKSSVTFEFS